MDQSKDAKRNQDLAQQLAAQFIAMRPTPRNPVASSSAATHAPAAASNTNITQLAAQLSQLLGQGASTEKEQQPQGELFASTTGPFTSVPDPSIYEKEFTDVYLNVNASVLRFEDRELLDLASDQMPIDKFFEEAESMTMDYPDDSIDDIVVRRLLHWFKNDYFTWVNQPPCARCQAKTTATGAVAPSAQERQDGAGIVETYKCTQDGCLEITRFPRYGGASKILFQTRRGRCGEWANVRSATFTTVDSFGIR
ncbi:peptide-N4-(N-acetyl-beta- glucosaminyl)asparagine amidase [Mortierella alpina]|uniref:Peptide-N4-(N-acetyl-beta-glucosaminyl)asparagine amidase n=1 Tax=Mortierella alpina TaxID=64518 RepID=A0A9P6JDY3_MORAP|nr:peptide-N4-(N-acetyl-beta- glucosaminyl)asparagine amidase [Mortierella alpina]